MHPYQIYRFALSHSVLMILLTLFDVVVILLAWLEYEKQSSRRQTDGHFAVASDQLGTGDLVRDTGMQVCIKGQATTFAAARMLPW